MTRINIRAKGANGEREIANDLNALIQQVLRSQEWPEHVVNACANAVQRNQNQSAVGGNDLSNTFGLSIEVKRQEALAINSWWDQCMAAADRNKEVPVLLYRQNHKPWRAVTFAALPLHGQKQVNGVRCEMSYEDFKAWFYQWVYWKLAAGEVPRI